jgi:hypothetical protein
MPETRAKATLRTKAESILKENQLHFLIGAKRQHDKIAA